jgi:hypothetical protein
MTNNEVISRLRALHLVSEDLSDKEAILIAIKTLKQSEIIKCKDCCFYAISKEKRSWCKDMLRRIQPEDFCSHAKRREE